MTTPPSTHPATPLPATARPEPAFVVWLTGLSGAGKSSLARALEARLASLSRPAMVLDGDVLRAGLCADLGFSQADRRENVRRVAEVAKLVATNGTVVIAALISPLQADRELARRIIGTQQFLEIYCRCPLEACEARDVKGLYRRARNGEIAQFTGIDSPYEVPQQPDFEIDTEHDSLSDCTNALLDFIVRKYGLRPID